MKKELKTISRLEVFKNRKLILKNPLPFHHENFDKYGDTFMVSIGIGQKVVFTRDAETIQHILQKNHKTYHKSPLQTKDLAKYIGHGLLTSNGDFWKVHRRMIQPAFHKKKLQGLLGIMNRAITAELSKVKPGGTYDVFPSMGDIAFQVVAQSLFSADNLRSRMRQLQDITEANQKMLIKEMRQPFKKWWFQLSGETGRHLKKSEEARELLNNIIEERITSSEEKDDLLDMLLKARYEDGSPPMNRRQLIDEVMILFTAGHETTANALSFSLYLLAKNPHIQEKLHQEVLNVGSNLDLMHLMGGQLPLVKNCIEEAIRLYPPVYVIDRISINEDLIKGNTFKKGTLWLLSLYELHRKPEVWKDPETFNPPLRFGKMDPPKVMNQHFYPFGAGRECVLVIILRCTK